MPGQDYILHPYDGWVPSVYMTSTTSTAWSYTVPGHVPRHEPSDSCPEDCPKCRALFRKNGKPGRDMD